MIYYMYHSHNYSIFLKSIFLPIIFVYYKKRCFKYKKTIKTKKMCVYRNCRYLCLTKEEHHSRYATMRKNTKCSTAKDKEEIKKSSKVNWDVVDKLKKR